MDVMVRESKSFEEHYEAVSSFSLTPLGREEEETDRDKEMRRERVKVESRARRAERAGE